MENSELDKVLPDHDEVSYANLNVDESLAVIQAEEEELLTGAERQLSIEERGLSEHPERSGLAEWKADSDPEAHLRDSIVYGAARESGPELLSFYEVTQQRDQSLYEKASCSSDVIRVWNQISHYVKAKLRQGSGVIIPGLGTFTTVLSKRWRNSSHFNFLIKPIFIVSETLTVRYKLQDPSTQVSGFRAPASLMNLTDIGINAKVSRTVVDGVVTEVLQTFARALVCGKPIEFPFPYIGKLQVRSRQCMIRFYAEFYRSMGYDCTGNENENPVAPTASLGIMSNWINRDDDADAEILPGRMTPLNTHIPTESFRSVFHLREVRSVHEFITVTEEDIRRVDCLEVVCLPASETKSFGDDTSVDESSVDDICDPVESKFIWCPPAAVEEDSGEGWRPSRNFPGERDGEYRDFNAWIQNVRITPPRFYSEEAGEGGVEQRPLTPAPSLLSAEEPGEVSPRVPDLPTSHPLPEEWELEPGKPCHHSYRPEPLYKGHASGNYVIDMVLSETAHYANALRRHHYSLCAKILGGATVQKHLSGHKVHETVGRNSEFHAF